MMSAGYQEIHAGVTCIDVEYQHPGFTAAWLIREADQAVLVETGPLPAVDRLLGALRWQGIAPEAVQAVIVTHVHLDHAGGAGALLRHLPNARLLVHARGVPHLVDPARLIDGAKVVYGEERFLATLGGAVPVDPARIHCPVDGEVFSLNGRQLTFLETPGHCLNHLCVLDERSHGLFTGDAFGLSYRAFDGGARPFFMPATTPTQFDVIQSRQTWRRLQALQPEWLYLTHFGAVPFDPAWVDDLEGQLEQYQQLAKAVYDEPVQAGLVAAMAAMTWERVQALGVPLDTQAGMRLLEMDLELNAQGLLHWHRRSNRPAGGSWS